MAPGSVASAILLEAYVGNRSREQPMVQGAARPSGLKTVTVHLPEARQGKTLEQLIAGSWAPPNCRTQPAHVRDLTHPGRGTAFGKLARWRERGPRLQASPTAAALVPPQAVDKAAQDFARVEKDIERLKAIHRTVRMAQSMGRHERPQSKCHSARESASSLKRRGSAVTHATTPSWRSVSPRGRRVAIADSEGDGGSVVDERLLHEQIEGVLNQQRQEIGSRRLEAKWAEVQYAPVPRSELRHLDGIESMVNQANAMLVESFLNVKRRAPVLRPASSRVVTDEVGSLKEGSALSRLA
mmetsp:Transcript_44763/g.103546  ORF Transcript_44763/g.103546 Transcript_44763/m.103546 type:complete len:298 (+) Transcript_44763:30-923(+)